MIVETFVPKIGNIFITSTCFYKSAGENNKDINF